MSVASIERTRKIKTETGTIVETGDCPANTKGWEATARARPALAAEVDGAPAGFMMARVDCGEFGRPEPAAVIDTIGVDPDHARLGVGHALISQLMTNLVTLRVDVVRTEVTWDAFGLLGFLKKTLLRPF